MMGLLLRRDNIIMRGGRRAGGDYEGIIFSMVMVHGAKISGFHGHCCCWWRVVEGGGRRRRSRRETLSFFSFSFVLSSFPFSLSGAFALSVVRRAVLPATCHSKIRLRLRMLYP